MVHCLALNGRTIFVSTFVSSLSLSSTDITSTYRAKLRKMEKHLLASPEFFYDFFNVGDDISGTAHNYCISYFYIQTLYLVFIVQSCPTHCRATYFNRLKDRHRG